MVYTPATKHPNGARLLALDGGGVRGIVALEVLKEIMARVKVRKGLKETPRPADYFELAAGTSTGGIIGIMLFRLHMTVEDTITQYDKIGVDVFSPKIYGWNIGRVLPVKVASFINSSKNVVQNSRFDDADLKKAIDDVVAKFGLDENDKKLKGDAPLKHAGSGRIICCTTAQNRSESVLLRCYSDTCISYAQSKANDAIRKHGDKMTISIAARATSAAPTFFPEVRFPETKSPKDKPDFLFWDGGLLNNNPIDQLWYSRYELVERDEPPPAISCVISLGTGYVRADSPSESWSQLVGVATGVMDFATNTNAKGKDFSRHMKRLNERAEHKQTHYVRFCPPLEKDDKIGLADYTRMEDLKVITRAYLKNEGGQKFIEEAVCGICCDGCEMCRRD